MDKKTPALGWLGFVKLDSVSGEPSLRKVKQANQNEIEEMIAWHCAIFVGRWDYFGTIFCATFVELFLCLNPVNVFDSAIIKIVIKLKFSVWIHIIEMCSLGL